VPWEISAGQKGLYTSYTFWAPGDGLEAASAPWEKRFQDIVESLQPYGAYFQAVNAIGGGPISPVAAPGTVGYKNESTRTFITWTYARIQDDTHIPLQQGWYPSGGTVTTENMQAVADLMVDAWRTVPSSSATAPFFNTVLFQWGGAAGRRNPAESALPWGAESAWLAVLWGGWNLDKQDTDSAAIILWVKTLYEKLTPYLVYNYLDSTAYDQRSANMAKFTYGQNWDAVQGHKTKYDPNNFFRNNLNIPPCGNAGYPPCGGAGARTSSSSTDININLNGQPVGSAGANINLNLPPSGSAGARASSSDSAVLGIVIACLVLLVTLSAINIFPLLRQIPPKTGGARTSLISQDGQKYSPSISSLPVENIGGGEARQL
jgi:hypothetical protein